ncbi:MAG: GGDEF domain-containing response regulator [Mycobacteriales bacterium]
MLVVDDDAEVAAFLDQVLSLEGFQVSLVSSGSAALAAVGAALPDLVLLDASLPDLSGLEVCRRLRAGALGGHLPVIMLTAGEAGADRVLALAAGADDCLAKPFDPLELVTRMRVTLRRSAEMLSLSPLTGLPGNIRIEAELARRIAAGQRFAVCYVDLDNFKAFNDRYGFLRGDKMIRLLASALNVAAEEAGEPRAFLGHVGGDDFVAVCEPGQVARLCARLLAAFDEAAPALHDPKDLACGGVEVVDRLGELRRFPLVSVSVGVATSEARHFADYREAVAIATEMKAVAKRSAGSAFAVDRRGSLVEQNEPPA